MTIGASPEASKPVKIKEAVYNDIRDIGPELDRIDERDFPLRATIRGEHNSWTFNFRNKTDVNNARRDTLNVRDPRGKWKLEIFGRRDSVS